MKNNEELVDLLKVKKKIIYDLEEKEMKAIDHQS